MMYKPVTLEITPMQKRIRQYMCFGVAVVLVVTGTIATGLVPSTPLYQVLAGSIIVAGFAVGYLCLSGFNFLE